MPHPPGSYTASAQPYTPSTGQPAYAPAPNQQAYAVPAPQYAAPAAPPPEEQPHITGYPNQSITDFFRGSTQPQAQTVPHPPSSYTPSGQPYPSPNQPGYGTPQNAPPAGAATAAPPSSEPQPHVSGYPNQSITDVFRQ
jgi:hypothetical protein